ncbi:MAG: FtsX-like permease family protein [Candidatus Cryptobacteroides sp.]|nr:FtsX-like permease family protein [Candidatus Cryptobacteroides sp.]
MGIGLKIAWRYLFAKKTQNVINIISAISACGMAVGTAALIIVLAVYNGFDSIVSSSLSCVEPDLLITPASGKYFVPEGEIYGQLYSDPSVKSICCVLEETVFLSYGKKQATAQVRGVDEIYEEESDIASHIVRGEYKLHKGSVPLACLGTALAHRLEANPAFVTPMEIWYPSRTRKFSAISPAASLESVKVWPSGIFNINSEVDEQLVIVPIETMRELLELKEEVSAVEIRLVPGEGNVTALRKAISDALGTEFLVKDRYMQNESLYKMMKYEKAAIYLILIFMVLVISLNIYGNLTMLTIEKRGDIFTLKSMGASNALIRRIFRLEGWLITLVGLVIGAAVGIAVVLLQEHFGIVKMPGGFLVSAYPVILQWTDVALVCISIALIGWLVTLVPSRRAAQNE